MEAKIGHSALYYETFGEGHPLVLIRGLGSNADHWYEQASVFSRQYRVIVFDNRGVARSSEPGGEFSVLTMAQDTLGLLDFLGIEKAHVFGLSMGGMIAQELAINYPDRVSSLVLACTHCGGPHQIRAGAEVGALFMDMIYVASDESKVKAAVCLFHKETLEKQSMGFRMSAWDNKLLGYGERFEQEMMDLSVNIPIEKALDLGWRVMADYFESEETGIPTRLIEKFWPKKAVADKAAG